MKQTRPRSRLAVLFCIFFFTALLSPVLLAAGALIYAQTYEPPPVSDQYLDYVPINGLTVQKTGKTVAQTTRGKEDQPFCCYYSSIPGFSEDCLVSANVVTLVGLYPADSHRYVLQNPENAVNIWGDWTVKSAVVVRDTGAAQTGKSILPEWLKNLFRRKKASLDVSAELLSDLAALPTDGTGETTEGTQMESLPLTLEIRFRETTALVWEATVRSAIAPDEERDYYLYGSRLDGTQNGSWSVAVPRGGALYHALEEAFEQLNEAD